MDFMQWHPSGNGHHQIHAPVHPPPDAPLCTLPLQEHPHMLRLCGFSGKRTMTVFLGYTAFAAR